MGIARTGDERTLAKKLVWDPKAKRLVDPEGSDDPRTTAQEAKPEPSPADDPRSSFDRNVGGPWAGGV